MTTWHDVKVRMPLEGKCVLILIPDVDRGLPGCEVASWWGDCWWTNGGPNAGSDMDEWSHATHWTDLPEFPKATGNA